MAKTGSIKCSTEARHNLSAAPYTTSKMQPSSLLTVRVTVHPIDRDHSSFVQAKTLDYTTTTEIITRDQIPLERPAGKCRIVIINFSPVWLHTVDWLLPATLFHRLSGCLGESPILMRLRNKLFWS